MGFPCWLLESSNTSVFKLRFSSPILSLKAFAKVCIGHSATESYAQRSLELYRIINWTPYQGFGEFNIGYNMIPIVHGSWFTLD